MNKITLKSIFFCSFCLLATGTHAIDSELTLPVFEKIPQPVPSELVEQGFSGIGQFYHVQSAHASWGDYNNDGYLDVFYSGRNEHINYWNERNCFYKNMGNETFEFVFQPAGGEGDPIRGGYWGCPVWLDFNSDGNLDLLLPGIRWTGPKDSFCRLYQNMGQNEDGDYVFEEVPNGGGIRKFMNEDNGGKSHQYVSVADYNNDGYIDVVVTGIGRLLADEDKAYEDESIETERMTRLYKNNAGLGFEEVFNPLVGEAPFHGVSGGSVNFVDLDKDGWQDIVSSGYGTTGELYVYWNNGDGTFKELEGQSFIGTYNSGSGIFDFNNDGFSDIVVTGFTSGKDFYIYKNNGDRSFDMITKGSAGFEGLDGGQLDFGDLNHDGLEDILVGGHGEIHEITTFIYLNKGDGTFQEQINPVTRCSHGSQNIIDFNNDGMLDVWVLGWTQSDVCPTSCTAELWKNTSTSYYNLPPAAPSNLKCDYNAETKQFAFSWDVSSDDVTPVSALKYNFFIKEKGSTQASMLIPADLTTGRLKVGAFSGYLTTNSMKFMRELDPSKDYEWGVQAIDNAKASSPFTVQPITFEVSNEKVRETLNVNAHAVNGLVYYQVNQNATISIIDLSGKKVQEMIVSEDGMIQGMKKGFYILNISTAQGNKTIPIVL